MQSNEGLFSEKSPLIDLSSLNKTSVRHQSKRTKMRQAGFSDEWRAHSTGYARSTTRKSTIRTWFYVTLVSLFCVLASRKIPTSAWPDALNRYSDVTARFLHKEQELPSLAAAATSLSSNGRTDEVQWDNYSLVLRGQRVFIQ